jgi:hypothetical protein
MTTKSLMMMRPSIDRRSVSANARFTLIVSEVTRVASFSRNVRLSLDSKAVRRIELKFVHRLKVVQDFKTSSRISSS